MYKWKYNVRAYYAEWRRTNKDRTREYKKTYKSKQKITSIVNFGNTKYFNERLRDRLMKDPGSRCQKCEIKVGPEYTEKKFYTLKDMKVCSQCFREYHVKHHHIVYSI